jgi:superoxide dismutase
MAHLNRTQGELKERIDQMMENAPKKKVDFDKGALSLRGGGWTWKVGRLWTHPKYNIDYYFEAALEAEGMELEK